MKLELKHLAGYLPYGLKAINTFKKKVEILGLQNGNESVNNILWLFRHSNGDYLNGYLYDCKPILHPLSDLTKEINNGLTYNDLLRSEFDKNGINGFDFYYLQETPLEYPFKIIQKLLEWHFDIHGLIENNLAIDINTINK